MDQKISSALAIIQKLALGALGNGLFKKFEDCNAIQNALAIISAELERVATLNEKLKAEVPAE